MHNLHYVDSASATQRTFVPDDVSLILKATRTADELPDLDVRDYMCVFACAYVCALHLSRYASSRTFCLCCQSCAHVIPHMYAVPWRLDRALPSGRRQPLQLLGCATFTHTQLRRHSHLHHPTVTFTQINHKTTHMSYVRICSSEATSPKYLVHMPASSGALRAQRN